MRRWAWVVPGIGIVGLTLAPNAWAQDSVPAGASPRGYQGLREDLKACEDMPCEPRVWTLSAPPDTPPYATLHLEPESAFDVRRLSTQNGTWLVRLVHPDAPPPLADVHAAIDPPPPPEVPAVRSVEAAVEATSDLPRAFVAAGAFVGDVALAIAGPRVPATVAGVLAVVPWGFAGFIEAVPIPRPVSRRISRPGEQTSSMPMVFGLSAAAASLLLGFVAKDSQDGSMVAVVGFNLAAGATFALW